MIDSNIWLFSEIESTPEHSGAAKHLEEITKNDTIGVNAIIVSEVYHKLSRLFDSTIACARMNTILDSTSVELIGLEPDTIKRAMRLARDFKMRINDAIIAQHAIDTNSAVFTDDSDFDKIKHLKLIHLRKKSE